jgi:transcriptional regulator with XRE-family HTH domain
MTGQELRRTRERMGLSLDGLARELRCSKDAVARWEREERAISYITQLAIKYVEQSRRGRRAREANHGDA